jgi:hypothetical protein
MTMSTKITMALVAAVIACAPPALGGCNGNRDTEHTYETAQYCIPQLDELPGTTRLYC